MEEVKMNSLVPEEVRADGREFMVVFVGGYQEMSMAGEGVVLVVVCWVIVG